MKLSKKFFEDLHKIGEWAFVEKNMWVGKLVPEIIVDNLQKRGINQGDLEGVVCLTIEEAKYAFRCISYFSSNVNVIIDKKDRYEMWEFNSKLRNRIEQAEGK